MKITKTTTKTYDIFDCAKVGYTIEDVIYARKCLGKKSLGLDGKCFACNKNFKPNDYPYLAFISDHRNMFICEDCARKVNPKRIIN